MQKKIKILVVPSDHTGVGKFRSIDPHVYIANHYKDDFDVDIVYMNDFPQNDLESFFKQYDLIHVHKQFDKGLQLMSMIKFLEVPVIVDVDDYYYLGNDHPMSVSAKKERWHESIIKHLELADYVSTTTPIFAKEIKKHNKNVLVFPNAVDPEEKQFSVKKNPSDKLRVGIICGSSHLRDIELMKNIASCATPDTNVQLVLCGFDTNGTRTIYHNDTGQVERRAILPHESVWFEYEKLITDNYKYISPKHKEFLLRFAKGIDDPFVDEPYRRMWTRDISSYATHYENVDVLLAPLKENDFNKMKSQLKEIEAGFTNTALVAQNFGAYTIDLIQFKERGGTINENGTAMLVDPRKNHKDWKKDIDLLAAHPEYVEMLKKNLHVFVKDKYHLGTVCKQRVEEYKRIVEEKKK